jgi:hypothetical protein
MLKAGERGRGIFDHEHDILNKKFYLYPIF